MPDPRFCGFLIAHQGAKVDEPARRALEALDRAAGVALPSTATLELLKRPRWSWARFDVPAEEHSALHFDPLPRRKAAELAKKLRARVWFIGFSDHGQVVSAFGPKGERRWTLRRSGEAQRQQPDPLERLGEDTGLVPKQVFPYGGWSKQLWPKKAAPSAPPDDALQPGRLALDEWRARMAGRWSLAELALRERSIHELDPEAFRRLEQLAMTEDCRVEELIERAWAAAKAELSKQELTGADSHDAEQELFLLRPVHAEIEALANRRELGPTDVVAALLERLAH